jgi:cation transport regulator ChaC
MVNSTMSALIKSSHRGHWRSSHTHRTTRERVGDILWWAVITSTLGAAIAYAVYLFQ